MLWIVAEESRAYDNDKSVAREYIIEQIRKNHPEYDFDALRQRLKTLHYDPSPQKVNEITDVGDLEKEAIVSPRYPEDIGYAPVGFFTTIEIRGDYFPYTEEQLSIGVRKEEILQRRLGLSVKKTTKTFDDMAGADILRKDIIGMLKLEKVGLFHISGLFLFGVAGAGKSYFAECFAGETGRMFASLDLPHFMSLPHPTRSIDEVFDFLLSQEEKYVLLIDEIEKMFDFGGSNLKATQVFGKLLTRLNDIYQDPKSNLTFVATANSITGIMEHNPEFLRKGRFNRLYFLNYPSKENAIEIFELFKRIRRKMLSSALIEYMESMGSSDAPKEGEMLGSLLRSLPESMRNRESVEKIVPFLFYDFDPKRVIVYIEEKYQPRKISSADSFIYTPPEIQAVTEEIENNFLVLLIEKIESQELSWDEIFKRGPDPKSVIGDREEVFVWDIVTMIVPLQISASTGVSKQIAQSRSFGRGGTEIQQFTEVS